MDFVPKLQYLTVMLTSITLTIRFWTFIGASAKHLLQKLIGRQMLRQYFENVPWNIWTELGLVALHCFISSPRYNVIILEAKLVYQIQPSPRFNICSHEKCPSTILFWLELDLCSGDNQGIVCFLACSWAFCWLLQGITPPSIILNKRKYLVWVYLITTGALFLLFYRLTALNSSIVWAMYSSVC